MNITGEIHVHKTETPIAELPVLEEVSGDEKLKIYDNGVAKSVTLDKLMTGIQSGQGLTEEIKVALLRLAQKVSYIDQNGQVYYDELYNALYPPAAMLRITAAFNQGTHVIYDTDTLNSLRQYLTVTGLYSDGRTQLLSQYDLIGVLTEGTSTITVSYNSLLTDFEVSVTHKDVVVTGLSAVFEQGNHVIYDNASLDSLRQYLTVTASFDDETSAEVSNYTLSGTLAEGTSTITASFGGQSDTFTVVVTQHQRVAVSVSATFTQGSNVIYDTASLDSLRQYLVVSVTFDDSTSETVTDYLLGGTLTEGTSTISVYYGTLSTTFTVTVTHYVPETVSITWVNGNYDSSINDFKENYGYQSRMGITEILYDRGNGFDFVIPTIPEDDTTTHFAEGATQIHLAILAYDSNGVHVGQINPQTMEFIENPTSWTHTLADIGGSFHIPTGYGIRFFVTQKTAWGSNARMKAYLPKYMTSVTR